MPQEGCVSSWEDDEDFSSLGSSLGGRDWGHCMDLWTDGDVLLQWRGWSRFCPLHWKNSKLSEPGWLAPGPWRDHPASGLPLLGAVTLGSSQVLFRRLSMESCGKTEGFI